jgi:hypothetical protein
MPCNGTKTPVNVHVKVCMYELCYKKIQTANRRTDSTHIAIRHTPATRSARMLGALGLKRAAVEALDTRLMHNPLASSHAAIHEVLASLGAHKAHGITLNLDAWFLSLAFAAASRLIGVALIVAPFTDGVPIDLE